MALSKKQKVLAVIAASLAGVSVASMSSVIVIYDMVFPRYERPDYALYPGQYCIERVPGLARSELWIPAKDNRLKAYYYMAPNAKGLVVFCHGIKAGADEYLPIFQYLVNHGYSVLAYNVTGTYESEGASTVGMCQSLVDMDDVLNYVKSNDPFNRLPLFTMGHSWGGYAASSVLSIHQDVQACAVIAPVCDASSMLYDKAAQYAGNLVDPTKPLLDVYQQLLFEDYVQYNAIDGINQSNVPVLVAQGQDDKVITYNRLAITARIDEITNKNVQFYIGKGLQSGHDTIWHSEESVRYQQQVTEELKRLEKEKGDDLTDAEKAAYYRTVDHALYSEVNVAMMEKIVAMFDGALR